MATRSAVHKILCYYPWDPAKPVHVVGKSFFLGNETHQIFFLTWINGFIYSCTLNLCISVKVQKMKLGSIGWSSGTTIVLLVLSCPPNKRITSPWRRCARIAKHFRNVTYHKFPYYRPDKFVNWLMIPPRQDYFRFLKAHWPSSSQL